MKCQQQMHRCLTAVERLQMPAIPQAGKSSQSTAFERSWQQHKVIGDPWPSFAALKELQLSLPLLSQAQNAFPPLPVPLWQCSLSRVLLHYSKQVQMCDLRETWLGLNKRELQTARPLLNGDTALPPSIPPLSPAFPGDAEMLICITSPKLTESILLPSAQQWAWFIAALSPGLWATALAVRMKWYRN